MRYNNGFYCTWAPRRYLFTFSTSSLKPLDKISRNLTGSKNSMSSTTLCFFFFGPSGKWRWPPSLWYILDFSETAKWKLTKLDRKQELNVLCQVFLGPSENQIGHWLAETFPNILWNRWPEFEETWKDATTHREDDVAQLVHVLQHGRASVVNTSSFYLGVRVRAPWGPNFLRGDLSPLIL